MAWRVEFGPRARRALRKLDRQTAARLIAYVEQLEQRDDPRSTGKALAGELAGFWRYRVGDHRLICRIEDQRLVILVLDMEGDKAAQRARNWDDWMNAVEHGLAGPMPGPDEPDTAPVWQDENGNWLTGFAPPDGFDGWQSGRYGEEDYCREATADERTAIASWLLRAQEDAHRRRDSYFHQLAAVSSPR